MNAFAEVDMQIGARAERIYRPSQAVRQTREVDMEVPQILPDPRQPAGSAKPPLQPARPHQVPASWGQGTASMPTAPMPMSVDVIGEAENVNRIRQGMCTNCWEPVPYNQTHPDPCLKPTMCHTC